MINTPPPFNLRALIIGIPIIVPIKERFILNQGSTLASRAKGCWAWGFLIFLADVVLGPWFQAPSKRVLPMQAGGECRIKASRRWGKFHPASLPELAVRPQRTESVEP